MTQKPEELRALLTQLTDERSRLDGEIEEMILEMSLVPPEQRTSGPWARDGVSTRRYLELTTRQADVEAEIVDLSRAIAESGNEPPSKPH